MDRQHDINMIESELKRPDITPAQTAQLKAMLHKIRNESAAVRDMRKHLIKAHQEGNKGELDDIREFVERHPKYRND